MPFMEPDAQLAGPLDGQPHTPRFHAAIWPETSEVQQHIGHDGPCAWLSLGEHNDVSYVDKDLSSTIPTRAGHRGGTESLQDRHSLLNFTWDHTHGHTETV
jgi:hypothetical protein